MDTKNGECNEKVLASLSDSSVSTSRAMAKFTGGIATEENFKGDS